MKAKERKSEKNDEKRKRKREYGCYSRPQNKIEIYLNFLLIERVKVTVVHIIISMLGTVPNKFCKV